MRRVLPFIALLLITPLLAKTPAQPIAATRPYEQAVHGDTLRDPWHWLRDRDDPALPKVLKAERKYAAKAMRPSRKLASQLYREMRANIRPEESSHPYPRHGYLYYTRQTARDPYPIHCRKADVPNAPEEVLLDENVLARGSEFFSLGDFTVSRDGNLLAYSADTTGNEDYRLYIKDLRDGSVRDSGIDHFSECVWMRDSHRLLYIRVNDRYQADTAWYWDLAEDQPVLIATEADPAFDMGLYTSSDEEVIFLTSSSKDSSEISYLSAASPLPSFKLFIAREDGHQYWPDHYRGSFIIQSDCDDPDGAIYRCFETDTSVAGWTALVPGDSIPPLSGFIVCDTTLVLICRPDGFERLAVHSLATGAWLYDVPTDGIANLGFWVNADPEEPCFYYTSESALMPWSIYCHNLLARSDSLVYRSPAPKSFDPADFVIELRHATATDGTSIPVSIKYLRGLDISRPHPLVLSGYGAYGDSEDPYFSAGDLSIMRRGVVLVTAHPRGGGEFGRAWYDGGRMLNKRNTFTDFIACAKQLIKDGITTPGQLAIYGGSAGGLLIGAVLNLEPGLCAAAWLDVPFVDVLNTMLDPSLPLTVQEYEEWGDPGDPAAFRYMQSYSPYDNVRQAAYPAVYLSAAWQDTRVGYWEGLKLAQKLRTYSTSGHPVVYRLLEDEGHSGSGDRFKSLREYCEGMAWLLWQTGVRK